MAKDDGGNIKYGKDFQDDKKFKSLLEDTSIDAPVSMRDVHKKINSLVGMFDKSQSKQLRELKSISTSVNSASKSQKSLVERIRMKELASGKEIKVVEKSVQVILGKLGYAIDSISRGSKKILLDTAKYTKESIKQYGQALKEDFNINKGNFLAMSLSKASPLFGYFAGKFMETDIFRKATQAIRDKFSEAITFVGNKIKDLWGRSIDKFKDVYSRLPDIMERMSIIIKELPKQVMKFMNFLNTLPKKFFKVVDMGIKLIGTLPKKLFKFLDVVVDKTIEWGVFISKLPFKALKQAFKGIVGAAKLIVGISWKSVTFAFRTIVQSAKFLVKLPFQAIGLAFKSIAEIAKFIPKTILKGVGAGFRAMFEIGRFFVRLPARMFNVLLKSAQFLIKIPFRAVGAVFGAIVKTTKFLLTLPFKAISGAFKAVVSIIKAPFKLLGAAFSAVRSGFGSAKKGSEKKVIGGQFGAYNREQRLHGVPGVPGTNGEFSQTAMQTGLAVRSEMQPMTTKLDKLITILKWSAYAKIAHIGWKFFGGSSYYNKWLSKSKDPQTKLASDFSTFFTFANSKYDSMIATLKDQYKTTVESLKAAVETKKNTKTIKEDQKESVGLLTSLKRKAGGWFDTLIAVLSSVFSSVLNMGKGIFSSLKSILGIGAGAAGAGGIAKKGGGLLGKMGSKMSLAGGTISGIMSGMRVGKERGTSSGIAQGAISGSLSTIGGLVLGPVGAYVGKLLGDAIGKAAFGLGDWLAKHLDLFGLVHNYIVNPIKNFFMGNKEEKARSSYSSYVAAKKSRATKVTSGGISIKSTSPVYKALGVTKNVPGESPQQTTKNIKGDDFAKSMIKRHEGLNLQEYKDSLGYPTIGYGHLLRSNESHLRPSITYPQANGLFEQDYAEHKSAAEQIPGYDYMNLGGKAALTDLTFNMGPAWYKKWPTFTKNLREKNYSGAATSIANSLYAKQVGSRASEIAGLIASGGEGSVNESDQGRILGGNQLAKIQTGKDMTLASMFNESSKGMQNATADALSEQGKQSQIIVNNLNKTMTSMSSSKSSGNQTGSKTGDPEIESILLGQLA